MAVLTVLMGVPGAGKTTWAEANLQPGEVFCCTDRLRTGRLGAGGIVAVVEALRTRARRALGEGRDVLVDACNTRRNERTRWRDIAHQHRADTRLVVVHASLAEVLDVQRGRAHPVAEHRVRGYVREFEQALRTIDGEGWGRIFHMDRDGDLMADRGHNGHGWRTLRAATLAVDDLTCGICWDPIDKTLRFPDPWSKTVDLIIPWAKGGQPVPGNVRPAHLHCNSSRGAGKPPKRRWVTDDQP